MATTSTYYFDGHNGVTNDGSAWTNPNNAFDGNTGTLASTSTLGSVSSNYLEGAGTTAGSITDYIVSVRVRFYCNTPVGGIAAAFSIDSFSTQLVSNPTTAAFGGGTPGWSPYYTIEPPTGGWTSVTDIQNMKVRLWNPSITSPNVYKVEIEVTTTATAYSVPIMVANTANLAAATSERFFPIQATSDVAWATTTAAAYAISSGYSRISNLKVTISTAPGTGVTRTFAVYVNGVDTSLTVSISGASTTATDSTNSISLGPGDLVALHQTVTGGTPVASSPNFVSMKKIGENQSFLTTSNGAASTTLDRYFGIQSTGGIATSAANATQYMAESGNLKNFYASLDSTLGSGTYDATLYKNGVATSISFTGLNSATASSDTSTSISYSAGDYFYIVVHPNTPGATKRVFFSMDNIPTTTGNFALISSNYTSLANGAARYNNWYGDGAWNATESNETAVAYAFTLTNIYFVLGTDTGAGKTRVMTFRKNTSATSATVTFNNTGTTKTWSGTVSVADGDGVSMETVPSGTPTTATGVYTLIAAATALTPPSPPASTSAPQMMMMGVG